VTIGFVGVLIMLSPHLGAGAHPVGGNAALGAMLGLAGAFCSAFASVEVRLLTATERTGAIVFYFMLLTSLLGLSTILIGWNMPNLQDAAMMVLIGILGGLGQILIVQAYRYGDASLIAPFEYSTMLWAVAIGWFWFGEWPTLAILIGATIVIVSGMITGCVGGVLRDVLCNDVPLLFRSELYASVSVLTGALYVGGLALGLPHVPVTIGAMAFGLTLRLLALRFQWNMPKFIYAHDESGE